jgi:hypothetical protein
MVIKKPACLPATRRVVQRISRCAPRWALPNSSIATVDRALEPPERMPPTPTSRFEFWLLAVAAGAFLRSAVVVVFRRR